MSLDPFRNYDAWLERPYQEAAARADAFVDWCEREGVDPDAPDAWDRYEAAIVDAQEAAAEARAEARAEAYDDYDPF